MKTFARFTAVCLLATCASAAAVAQTVSLTSGPDKTGTNDPTKAPIPTCTPGYGCTFPVGR